VRARADGHDVSGDGSESVLLRREMEMMMSVIEQRAARAACGTVSETRVRRGRRARVRRVLLSDG